MQILCWKSLSPLSILWQSMQPSQQQVQPRWQLSDWPSCFLASLTSSPPPPPPLHPCCCCCCCWTCSCTPKKAPALYPTQGPLASKPPLSPALDVSLGNYSNCRAWIWKRWACIVWTKIDIRSILLHVGFILLWPFWCHFSSWIFFC